LTLLPKINLRFDNIKYRSEIDGLRAFAVLSVVIFHFFPQLLPNGYLGVDLFFVISGFLITSQLIDLKNKSIKDTLSYFYKRRIKRLFPALFLSLTISYLFVSLFFISDDVHSFEKSLFAAYTFWANFFFWHDGGYFGGSDQLKPLLHIWSVSVEEQFYLIYPFILVLMITLNQKIKYLITFTLVLFTIISFVLWLYLNSIGGQNPAFFLLPTRIWQFGLGAILATTYGNLSFVKTSILANRILFCMSVGLISLGIFANIGFQLQALIVSIGAVGFIAFSHQKNSYLLSFFQSKLPIFFGKISYSLYLYHWPIAVALNYYFTSKVPFFFSLLGVLVSFLLGLASFIWIENNFRYKFSFKVTISFLILCLLCNSLIFFVNKREEDYSLTNIIAKASGSFFECSLHKMKPFGASRACIINKSETSDKIIVILGNSHAQMYTPLVSEVSPRSFNVLLVPLNGCLPTTSVNISSKCLQQAKKNLSSVLNNMNVQTVIIGTTWYANKYVNSDGILVDKNNLKLAIEDLISEIRHSGKHPILFSPIAVPERDHASELARKLRFGQITEQEVYDIIKFPRSEFDDKFGELNLYFNNLLGDSYIKIYDDLCNHSSCFFGTDKLFYFADNTHLSKYAVTNFSKAKKQLQSLLSSLE